MALFTNVGGQLKEPSVLPTNVGGQLKELNSLYTNVGGQLKEIYTMIPKNISGTWHLENNFSSGDNVLPLEQNCIFENLRFPIGRGVKIKSTITITDGYVHKSLSGELEQLHGVRLQIYNPDSAVQLFRCGTMSSYDTETTYTNEITYSRKYGDIPNSWNVYVGRWAGYARKKYDTIDLFYHNSELSFDYSLEFELL